MKTMGRTGEVAWVALVAVSLLLGCGGGSAESADAGGGADADAGRAVCDEVPGPYAPLSTRCRHFVDGDGRVVVLHGVNARVEGLFDVTFDDGRTALHEPPELTAEDTRRMRALGFNVLRLPVNWSGIEPEDTNPPTYDAAYLDHLASVLDLCREAGLFVIIDFHQDAYSKEIGEDGAPLWAIQPPPEMLLEGPLRDLDARRASAQVLRAFATFFGDDEPGPTLRARFAAMVARVATRFRDHPAVMGYEVFNEPVATFAQNHRLNLLVTDAIRASDPSALVVFEPPVVMRLAFDRSTVPDAPYPDTGAVYAPHIYTLAFGNDDEARSAFTRDTLRVGHASAAREADAWGTPLFVGEYGYNSMGVRVEDYFAIQLDLMDEFQSSAAFWVWKEDSGPWGLYDHVGDTWQERPHMVELLSHATPERIAGWPEGWKLDREGRKLELRYEGSADVTAPTQLYVPERHAGSYAVTCDDAAIDVPRDAFTGLVDVPCVGEGPHEVVLAW